MCAAGTLTWLLVAGDLVSAARAAPWLALLSWFAYATQWRPCLRVDSSGLEVVNGWRDHRIPFGAVTDIEVRFTALIWAAGKKYVSWGAPTPLSAFGSGFQHQVDLKSRPFAALPSNERISQPETKSGRDAIVAAWREARAAGVNSGHVAVASKWNAPVIIVGLLAAGSVIATALV